jgi:hypothetical protein
MTDQLNTFLPFGIPPFWLQCLPPFSADLDASDDCMRRFFAQEGIVPLLL